VLDKKEVNLSMLFKTPGIMFGFLYDLVSHDIIPMEMIGSSYVDDGSNMVAFGLHGVGRATGADSLFDINVGSYSVDTIVEGLRQRLEKASPAERAVITGMLCTHTGLLTSLLANITSGVGKLALGMTPLQAGLPNGAKMTSVSLLGSQMAVADDFAKIAAAIEPSGGAVPEYASQLAEAVRTTSVQTRFTDIWNATVRSGSIEELTRVSSQITDLRAKDSIAGSSKYLEAIQARIQSLVFGGIPSNMNSVFDLSREIARVGAPHTPKAVVTSFQERIAGSTLRGFAAPRTNANLLMNQLAVFSQGLDARLSMSNSVQTAFNNLSQLTKVQQIPGTARETIFSIHKDNVQAWNRNARILALEAPDLFASFIRGAGVIAIAGLSGIGAETPAEYVKQLGMNFAWTCRFGPLAFALFDPERYGVSLRDGKLEFHNMTELALITAQTGVDLALGAQFAARTVLRGQWNVGTLGEFSRFIAPVAFDAAELGMATVRTAATAQYLASGVGRTGAAAAAQEMSIMRAAGGTSKFLTTSAAEIAAAGSFMRTGAMPSGMRSLSFLGTAGVVLAMLGMANSAYAYVDGKLDQQKLEAFIKQLKAEKVIREDDSLDYAQAGIMLRKADPSTIPEAMRKRFYDLTVVSLLDPSIRPVEGSASGDMVNQRLRDIDVTRSQAHRPGEQVWYSDLYSMPFQVMHSGDKISVTFTNGPISPHEKRRIIYAFNAMGYDAEANMSDAARLQYQAHWEQYLDKTLGDNTVMAKECEARGIPNLQDGTPDRTAFIRACREEYMILAGVEDPRSFQMPVRLRQTT